MKRIDRDIVLDNGFKLRLEETHRCPRRVLDKIDEIVDWINKQKEE